MSIEDHKSRLQIREGYAVTIDESLKRIEHALGLLRFSTFDLPMQIESVAPVARTALLLTGEEQKVAQIILAKLFALGILPPVQHADASQENATVRDFIRAQHARIFGGEPVGTVLAELGQTVQ